MGSGDHTLFGKTKIRGYSQQKGEGSGLLRLSRFAEYFGGIFLFLSHMGWFQNVVQVAILFLGWTYMEKGLGLTRDSGVKNSSIKARGAGWRGTAHS